MNATQVITAAKSLGIKGALIKTFKNGQELRAYSFMFNGFDCTSKIRAFPGEHA